MPEAAHLRAELNKIDSLGLKEAQAQRMADALKDTPLPDKVSPGTYYGQGIPPSHYNSKYLRTCLRVFMRPTCRRKYQVYHSQLYTSPPVGAGVDPVRLIVVTKCSMNHVKKST